MADTGAGPDYSTQIGTGVGLFGTGLSLFSGLEASNAANAASQQSMNQTMLSMQVQTQQEQMMELNARRQQMQTVRQQQMARSLATTNATSQGAQFGSGLQGGLASITGQAATNQAGVSAGLQSARQISMLDTQIDASKLWQARDQQSSSMWQGIGAIGGALAKASGSLGSIGGSLASFAPLLLAA
jgi:hypothetical protein